MMDGKEEPALARQATLPVGASVVIDEALFRRHVEAASELQRLRPEVTRLLLVFFRLERSVAAAFFPLPIRRRFAPSVRPTIRHQRLDFASGKKEMTVSVRSMCGGVVVVVVFAAALLCVVDVVTLLFVVVIIVALRCIAVVVVSALL